MSTDSKRGGEQWVFLMVSLAVSLEKSEASKIKKIEIIKKHFFFIVNCVFRGYVRRFLFRYSSLYSLIFFCMRKKLPTIWREIKYKEFCYETKNIGCSGGDVCCRD